jgi:pyrroloquinoline quinone (PQQ) biosynthesis protein C
MDMIDPTFDAFRLHLIRRMRGSSFLTRCRNGAVSLDELKLFLVQQGQYSGYFTRYLCALMANLPGNQQVIDLAGNLCEELGLTDDSVTPHSALYRRMLEHFGVAHDQQGPLPGTRRLIDTMFDHCRDTRVARGLGALCLGAEALVPAIYSDIVAGFRALDVPASAIEFFQIHIECDDGHAETMEDIMRAIAQRDSEQFALMQSAGDALVDARLEFFNSIEARHRMVASLEPAV